MIGGPVIKAWSVAFAAAACGFAAAAAAPVTFNKNVAAILFDRCVVCHHPNGPAPFSLITYATAKQHATQIAAVTQRRVMPPWKTEPGYGDFVGQQPLSAEEIDTLQRWLDDGTLEGDAADLPAPPHWTDGWQLGAPDLIVSLPQPFTLPAGGADVSRVFVFPVPIDTLRYVRGVEFRPGNAAVVHHANLRIDRTPASRTLDGQDPAPGYDGVLSYSAVYPDGHFLGWTPGQAAPLLPKGLAWRLMPRTDLVVEVHMKPSGKPELVAPSIGFYFGSDPPERTTAMIQRAGTTKTRRLRRTRSVFVQNVLRDLRFLRTFVVPANTSPLKPDTASITCRGTLSGPFRVPRRAG